MNTYGIYSFRKKKMDYILYSKNIKPHISVPQRETNCSNRENENQGFWENMDSDLRVKVTFLMNT